jgi:hypothetical protein
MMIEICGLQQGNSYENESVLMSLLMNWEKTRKQAGQFTENKLTLPIAKNLSAVIYHL